MEFQIAFDEKTASFQINLFGKFNVIDLEICCQTFLAHHKWKEGSNILWDARESTFGHLKPRDMTSIAVMTNKYREQRGKGVAAWVVERVVDYGVCRMFEMTSEGKVNYDFRLFKEISDARECIVSLAKQN